MTNCFFVSDLHGSIYRYKKLFEEIKKDNPEIVFFGGDLLPHGLRKVEDYENFTSDFLFPNLRLLQDNLQDSYPDIFIILGNDDARSEEKFFIAESKNKLFHYLDQDKLQIGEYTIYGYPYVPPTPFQMKDWEKYDVSRYVDPGCIHPTEGFRTIQPTYDVEYTTILNDLENLTKNKNLSKAIFLFHSPPYKTNLDRAALDGKMVDHVPMDVHVGSIAIMRLIEEKQPLITLHGHIHESTQRTGKWMQKIGNTTAINGSHGGPELCLVKFTPEVPEKAERVLL